MRITILAWLLVMIILSAGPRLNDYRVSQFQSLPNEAQSILAENKLNTLFPNDQGTPGILVFHNPSGDVNVDEAKQILNGIISADIPGIETIVDIGALPPQALSGFMSEDKSTIIVPMNLEAGLGNKEYAEINDEASRIGNEIAKELSTDFYITGPAGIAGDTVKLFEQADFCCSPPLPSSSFC